MKQIKDDKINGNKVFYFSALDLNEEIEFVNRNNISHIELNPYVVDFHKKNIDFLKEVNNLKGLSIVGLEDIDISNINDLITLERLYLDTNKSKEIDFSNMRLNELNIRYSKSMKGIFSIKNLSKLIISFGSKELFTLGNFSQLNSLRKLEIIQSDLPFDFMFLCENDLLNELEISYIRKQFTLNSLELLNLNILKIMNCKKVDIKNISNLKYLEEFSIVDSVTLPDKNVFTNMEHLKSLIVLGSSYFCDGNLKELQDKLEYLGIDNKKHYNIKYIDPK
jgi:hypothetical protein